MKPLTKIIFSLIVVTLGFLCVTLVLLNNNSTMLVIYNPVKNSVTQKKVVYGKSIEDYLSYEDITDYTFVDYFYDSNFTKQVDKKALITSNITIVLGYSKNITSFNQVPNNVAGVSLIGDFFASDIELLLKNSYCYLDLSSANITGEINFVNTSVKTLILPSGDIKGFNNFQSLKSIQTSGETTFTNSFNNCENLSLVNLEKTTSIVDSFNNCKSLKNFIIPNTLTTLSYSLKNTHLDTIKNNSMFFVIENGILYYKENDFFVVKKAVNSVNSINLNIDTVCIDDYAFYKHKNIKNVNIDARLDNINSYSFAESSIEQITITQTNILNINSRAFYNCKNLTTINLGIGIQKINSYAFYGTNIKDISFNGSVLNYVGDYSFANCKNLTSVEFVNNPIEFGEGCFSYCINLEEIKNVNTNNIAEKSFENCYKLNKLTNWGTVNYIGNYAFYNCIKLQDIEELSGILKAYTGAFYNCSSIKKAEFLNLENLAEYLFYNCSSLQSFKTLQNVKEFNCSAFDNCINLHTVAFTSDKYLCTDSVVYNKDQTTLLYYAPLKTNTTFDVPINVENVNSKYLSAAVNLTTITSSSNKYFCKDGVLYSADKSKLISYPSAKKTSSFIVPEFVSTVCSYAFVNCPNLFDLTINSSVDKVENACLWQISALATLTLSFVGESLTNPQTCFLGWFFGAQNYTFNNIYVPSCLKSVVITEQESLQDYCFYDCSYLLTIVLDKVSVINNYMFYECINLQTVTQNSALKHIGEYAFYNCCNLTTLNWIYTSEFKSNNVQDSSFLLTPSWVKVNHYCKRGFNEEELLKYKEYFSNKTNNWIWDTIVVD